MSIRSMNASRARGGFTLVEILLVIMILGILAAIVVANVGTSTDDSRRNAFVTSLKTYVRLEAGHRAETGDFLEAAASGVCPTGFDRFINPDQWAVSTPIGGAWDSQRDEDDIVSAIGVDFAGDAAPRDDDFMAKVDDLLDDGDLAAGEFRKLGDGRYYYVLAQ